MSEHFECEHQAALLAKQLALVAPYARKWKRIALSGKTICRNPSAGPPKFTSKSEWVCNKSRQAPVRSHFVPHHGQPTFSSLDAGHPFGGNPKAVHQRPKVSW